MNYDLKQVEVSRDRTKISLRISPMKFESSVFQIFQNLSSPITILNFDEIHSVIFHFKYFHVEAYFIWGLFK